MRIVYTSFYGFLGQKQAILRYNRAVKGDFMHTKKDKNSYNIRDENPKLIAILLADRARIALTEALNRFKGRFCATVVMLGARPVTDSGVSMALTHKIVFMNGEKSRKGNFLLLTNAVGDNKAPFCIAVSIYHGVCVYEFATKQAVMSAIAYVTAKLQEKEG